MSTAFVDLSHRERRDAVAAWLKDNPKFLKRLSYREREIIKLRYGFDGDFYTLEELAHIFKVTRERIRTIDRARGAI